jgi:RND family efflux transporter MFP subunit
MRHETKRHASGGRRFMTRNVSPIERQAARAEPLPQPEYARRPSPVGIPLPVGEGDTQDGRPSRWRPVRWATLLVLLSMGAGAAYLLWAPPSVSVVQPRRGPAVQAVYATGTVEPTVMVPISAHNMARLVELDADEGSTVVKGQLLAKLEDDDLRRAVEVTEAEERYTKAELDRLAVLVGRQVVARSVYDRAKADWEKARAAAARAAVEAGYLQLMAPADGTMIRRDGEIGQMIGANQTVFWLYSNAPLRISAEVDEEDIAQVRPGQQVLIRADALPGQTFHGRVQAITPKGDPVARSYRVRISLPGNTPLMIGMTTETNIVLRQNDHALLLPAGSVQQDTVWRVEDGRLSPQKVSIGAKGTTEIEILEGVGESDWIVAAASPRLKGGQQVHAIPATGQR